MTHFGWAMSFHLLALLNLLLGLGAGAAVRSSALLNFIRTPRRSTAGAEPRLAHLRAGSAHADARLDPVDRDRHAQLSVGARLPAYLTDEKDSPSSRWGGWPHCLSSSASPQNTGGVLLDRIRPYQAPLIFVFGGAATALCIYGVMNSHQLGWIAFFLLAANACWARRVRRSPRCSSIMRGRRRSARLWADQRHRQSVLGVCADGDGHGDGQPWQGVLGLCGADCLAAADAIGGRRAV